MAEIPYGYTRVEGEPKPRFFVIVNGRKFLELHYQSSVRASNMAKKLAIMIAEVQADSGREVTVKNVGACSPDFTMSSDSSELIKR